MQMMIEKGHELLVDWLGIILCIYLVGRERN